MRLCSRLALASAIFFVAAPLIGCSSPEEKAQSYYERGQELLKNHEYAKAGLEFKNALQLKKNMLEAWRGLLEVETRSNSPQALVPVLRNIVDLDPSDVNSRLQLGRLLLAGGALDDALEQGNKATELAPRNPSAIALRAAVLLKRDDADAARREAKKALEIDPTNSEALIVLAADRVRQNDPNGALALIDQNLDAHRTDLGVQLFRLALLEKIGDGQKIEDQLKTLVSLFPKEVRFRQALADFHSRQGKIELAEQELRQIADADPNDLQARLSVVRLVQKLRGPDAARLELSSHIPKDGQEEFKFRLALSTLDFEQGKTAEAIRGLTGLISSGRRTEDIVSAKLELARVQLARKDRAAAESLVAEVLKQDARNTVALKFRATLELDQAKYESAIGDLRQALNDQPRNSELMLLLASAYERSGAVDLAEKQYADAIQASGFNGAVALNYAAFLRRRGNLEHAEEVLLETVKRAPANIVVLSALAELRLARENWLGAQAVADQIKKSKGGSGIGDRLLAASLNGQGKFDESLKLLEGLHDSAPNAIAPVVDIVNTLLRDDKPEEAIAVLRSFLKSNPDNAQALSLLGSVEAQHDKLKEAEMNFRSAIDKRPNEPVGYVSLAQFYVRQSKLDEAMGVLREGLAKLPDDYALHESLASLLEKKNEVDLAIKEYEYLLKQQPGSLVAANNLASLLSDHRNDKESLDRAYGLALMLSKSPVPSFQDTLGWISYLRGDKVGAVRLLEQAVQGLPARPVVRYHLGVVYGAAGELAKAREQFERALQLQPDEELVAKIRSAQANLKAEAN